MIFFPPAKINIGLSVLEKRTDAYHNIESFFISIPFYDIIEIKESDINEISYSGIPLEKSTEFIHTFQKYLEQYKEIPCFKVHLHKSIPPGKGLGGGSSDLACFVNYILEFTKKEELKEELKRKAFELSSDVAFFIDSQSAIVSGKGDVVEDRKIDLSGLNLVLFLPEMEVSTADYYKRLRANPHRIDWNLLNSPPHQWQNKITNAFEEIYCVDYPEFKEYKRELYDLGAEYVSLSGTGSAFYALFRERKEMSSRLAPIEHLWLVL